MIRCEKKGTEICLEVNGMGGVILSELELIIRQLRGSLPKDVILEAVNNGLEKDGSERLKHKIEMIKDMQHLADELTRMAINGPDLSEETKKDIKDSYKEHFGHEFKDEEQED